MTTRVIQMLNNYFKDGENRESKPEAQEALGEYCCLGLFDALHIELVEKGEGQEGQDVRSRINEGIVGKLQGEYNVRSVVCVTENDAEDEAFWQEAEKMPFLFVSFVNIGREEKRRPEKLRDAMEKVVAEKHVMAYYTYDHSEIAVIRTAESYLQGFQEVLDLYDKVDIFKMYTVFAVREDVLENCERVRDEIISCMLYATVKNQKWVEKYKRELARALCKKEEEIKIYETLGHSDCLIEILQVSIKKLLCCYKMGRLLTHTNSYYNQAFFNIETQFMIEGKENGKGSVGDQEPEAISGNLFEV